jgi:hypothetical protein
MIVTELLPTARVIHLTIRQRPVTMTTGPQTNQITCKPAHVVTFIKQSPVLKGHHFLVLS